jgi:rhodanese-related sulfurtransferase
MLGAASFLSAKRVGGGEGNSRGKWKIMSVPEITPDRAKALLSEGSGYVYLDVRSAIEFETGRPAGAWNIPLAEPNPATGQWEFNTQFVSTVGSRFPRDARLIVGCQSGGRSAQACEILLRRCSRPRRPDDRAGLDNAGLPDRTG